MKTTIGIKGLIGAIVATALLSAVGAVAFALPFSDTGGTAYEGQIDEITDAGCASGFNDGTFRPSDTTRRGQFAFWLSNCGGRVWSNTGTNTLTTGANATTTALTRTITTPGVSGSGQTTNLHLQGVVDLRTDVLTFNEFCNGIVRCSVDVKINVGGTDVATQTVRWNNQNGDMSPDSLAVPIQAVADVDTGTSLTYSLRVTANDLESGVLRIDDRSLVATLYPFSGNPPS